MSQPKNIYKWAFVGLLIAVTLIGASLYVNWRFTEMQVNFNKRVAANALSTNSQIKGLTLDNAVLEGQIAELQQAILDLENWITDDQANQNQRISNLESDVQNLNSRIDSTNRQLSSLWDYYYGLDDRLKKVECEVFHDTNCTAPECPPSGECPECGSPNYPCDYCGSSWCGRYDCGYYCDSCGRYYGP